MSLSSGDLTTLYTVKQYMVAPPSDAILSGLIARISRTILTVLNRPILIPHTYVQKFNGTGTRNLVLPMWPILELTSLVVSGIELLEAPQPSETNAISFAYGWRFQPWNGIPPGEAVNLELIGSSFLGGLQNVVVEYSAGYEVVDEAQTIPATTSYVLTPRAPYGIWATDEGVTYSNGTPLTAISSGTPTVGQYLPPDPSLSTPRTVYTFAAADASRGVLLSYGFIPADVEQAAIELISERSDYRKRLGVRSQSLASQESISYDNTGATDFIRRELRGYVNPIPTMTGAFV